MIAINFVSSLMCDATFKISISLILSHFVPRIQWKFARNNGQDPDSIHTSDSAHGEKLTFQRLNDRNEFI